MKQLFIILFLFFFYMAAFTQSWEELNVQLKELVAKKDFIGAIPIGEKAVLSAQKRFGENSSELANNLNYLALLYKVTGNYQKSEPLMIRAKDMVKKTLGETHAYYATSLINLGELYESMRLYEKAEPYYIQLRDLRKRTVGENHIDYVISLDKLGRLYTSMRQYEKAISFCMNALQIFKKIVGENNADYPVALNNIAFLYEKAGQNRKAEATYIETLQIRKKILGDKHHDYAESLGDLANLYKKDRQYDKAIPLYVEALNIKKKLSVGEHPDYIANVDSLAGLYSTIGLYEKAEPLYVELKEFRKKVGGEDEWYAFSLFTLGVTYQKMMQYEKAELAFTESKDLYKKLKGEMSEAYANSLGWLGSLYKEMSEYEKAESNYFQSEMLLKKIDGENHPAYADALYNLAILYLNMRISEKAEPSLILAKNISGKVYGDAHPKYAQCLNALGSLYLTMGQPEKAEFYINQALIIAKNATGETSIEYALGLDDLGNLYMVKGKYEKSEFYYNQAKEIKKKIYGENNINYCTSLNFLANIYQYQNQFEKAEPIYLQAISICNKMAEKYSGGCAAAINNLAILYETTGRTEKAELFFLQAKEIWEKRMGNRHPDFAKVLNNLGHLYSNLGQFEKAEKYMLTASQIQVSNIQNGFTNLSEKEKDNYVNRTTVNEENNSFLYYYKKAPASVIKNNFNLQLFFKSISLMDTRHMLEYVNNISDVEMRRIFELWQHNRNILSRQFSLPIAIRMKNLDSIEAEAQVLEKQLVLKSAEFQNQQVALQITVQDVQKNLHENEVALEFVNFHLYNKKVSDSVMYAAYILNKNDSIPTFVPLCEEKQLQQLFDSAGKTATSMVSSFYRGVEIKNNNSATLEKGLYNLIWKPLEPYLKGVKKISYSPAGKLYGVAFHALPVDSSTILMDKYQLQQYASTRQIALRSLENKTTKPGSIVLFGNASFTLDSLQLLKQKAAQPQKQNISSHIYMPQKRGSDNSTWKSLPGTVEEVNKIKQLFDQNKISTKTFVQTAASEENLKTLSGKSSQILHIATHGFFLPAADKKKQNQIIGMYNTYMLAEDPLLRSGLILAGGNYAWSGKTPVEGVEDGIATAYEISQLDLSKTELVVLSACETALGDIKGSEGVFGLQRAFKMAGVKKIIVSLWQVPDKETAELMTIFYSYWLNGKNVEESFYQAQVEMRQKYAPFYWAAFVLIE